MVNDARAGDLSGVSGPRQARLWLAVALAGLSGCQCGDTVTPVGGGFRVTPTAVDFGRVLEGDQASRALAVQALTRAAVTVTAVSQAPFSAPTDLQVPGGGEETLLVTFAAGADEASGTLTLSDGQDTQVVTLRGVGVRPLDCRPSGPCRTSRYSLDEDRCVEALEADDTSCDPDNLCLEQGQCKTGLCVAVARRCDDDDACTIDGCAERSGCVHTRRSCPPPSALCRLVACDAKTGCGEVVAPDGTLCGPASCETFQACIAGQCQTFPTPEGFECSPAMACLPVGRCRNQRCEQQPEPWVPRWVAPLAVVPSSGAPTLLADGTSLFFSACGLPPLDGGADAGHDAGAAATDDGGLEEPTDGGASEDAGADGGPAEVDAGPAFATRCGLVSFTSTGIDRYVTPYSDGLERRLLHVASRGVLLEGTTGLEYHASSTGELTEALLHRPTADGVALGLDGAVLLLDADGGLLQWTQDGGVARLHPAEGATALAIDETGRVFLWAPDGGVLVRLEPLEDGGLGVQALQLGAAGGTLTVSGDATVAGGQHVARARDGGWEAVGLELSSWTPPRLVRGPLQSPAQSFSFTRRCPVPLVSCAADEEGLWLTAHDVGDGHLDWEVAVLPADGGTALWEAALIGGRSLSQPLVAALTEVRVEGTSRAALQVFSSGSRLLVCPLSSETTRARGATFAGGLLYVLAERGDGGFALEAYGLGGLPVEPLGWSTPEGFQGWRRPR